MKSTKNGFYCSDCKKHLIDTTLPNAPVPQKGDCIVTDIPQGKYKSLSRTYRFALALFIVMGSSIILNNNANANQLIQQLDELKLNLLDVDSNMIHLTGKVCDTKNRSIKPVNVTVVTYDNEKLKNVYHYSTRRNSTYYFDIPEKYIGTEITMKFEYYGEIQEIKFKISESTDELPEVKFKRNPKDRFTKKRYPKRPHFVGKFKF